MYINKSTKEIIDLSDKIEFYDHNIIFHYTIKNLFGESRHNITMKTSKPLLRYIHETKNGKWK